MEIDMSKTYTAKEVAVEVLKKCEELIKNSKLAKKEHEDKKEDEKLIEEKIKEHHDKKCPKCEKEDKDCECKKEDLDKCGDMQKK
jgi:hypothetical protein